MKDSSKTRVIDNAPSPDRTFYNDIDFEQLNKIHKQARGVYEDNNKKSNQDITEEVYVVH
jgi:hypothetical protein